MPHQRIYLRYTQKISIKTNIIKYTNSGDYMKWTIEEYGLLMDKFSKIHSAIGIKKMNSKTERDILYCKKNSVGGITDDESQFIEEACRYEDGLEVKMCKLDRLKEKMDDAFDKLDRELDVLDRELDEKEMVCT